MFAVSSLISVCRIFKLCFGSGLKNIFFLKKLLCLSNYDRNLMVLEKKMELRSDLASGFCMMLVESKTVKCPLQYIN